MGVEDKSEEEAMAPTVSMETVPIVRQIKVLSLTTAVLGLIFNALSIASTSWIKINGRQEGLWAICGPNTSAVNGSACVENKPREWLDACRVLCCLSIITGFIAVILINGGIQSANFKIKYKFYTIAVLVLVSSVLSEVVALIIFPVKYPDEHKAGANLSVGWSYVIAWISVVLMFIATILLFIDKDADEAIDREKTCYYNEESIEDKD